MVDVDVSKSMYNGGLQQILSYNPQHFIIKQTLKNGAQLRKVKNESLTKD